MLLSSPCASRDARSSAGSNALHSLVFMVGGRVCFVLAQVLIARTLGSDGFGAFSLGWTIAGVGTLVGLLGLPHCCVQYQVHGRPLWRQGYLPIGLAWSTFLAVAIYFSSGWLAAGLFGAPESRGAIAGLALSIPMNVTLAIWSSSFKTFGWVRYGVFLTSAGLTIGPMIAVGGVWLLGCRDAAIYAYAYSAGLLPTVGLALLQQRKSGDGGESPAITARGRFALQSWLIHGLGVANLWVDRFMVATHSTLSQLGQYQAASQLSMIPMLLAATITSVFEAPIARAESAGMRTKVFVRAQLFQVHLTLAGCLVGMLTASTWLSLLFGTEFGAAGPVLALLLAAQLIRAMAGPAPTVLNLSGAPGLALWIVAASAATNIVLNFLLVPPFGAMGAAIGALIAAGVLALGALAICYRLKLLLPSFRPLIGVAVSLLAMGLGFLLTMAAFSAHPAFHYILTGVMLLSYFGPMAFLRVYAPEDEIARIVWRLTHSKVLEKEQDRDPVRT